MKKRVSILLRKILSENELFVIEQLYGLNGKEVLSGREIGEKTGFTHQRVYQIKNIAFKKLKRNIEFKSLMDFL